MENCFRYQIENKLKIGSGTKLKMIAQQKLVVDFSDYEAKLLLYNLLINQTKFRLEYSNGLTKSES